MKKILTFSLSCLFASSALAQLYDAQWLMGYKGPGEGDYSLLDFRGDTVRFQQIDGIDTEVWLGNMTSFICDRENGEPLLLTNHCKIYDSAFNPVPGSEELSPGPLYDFNCVEDNWYPVLQSIVFLPEMGNDSVFYLVHKDLENDFTLQTAYSLNMYLSVIVKKEDGTFHFSDKRLLVENSMMNLSRVTACLNESMDKWWIWTVEYNTGRFIKFLVGGQDTVSSPINQDTPTALINEELDIGHASFSPDGSLLGLNCDENAELILYDFDNATGELSNYRTIPYPDSSNTGMGLAFSSDSKLAYVTSGNELYQIDIEEETVAHIAHHASFDEGNWPVGMGYLYSGPDCRIYVAPGTTTYYIHVVHHPNEKGAACGFQPRAVRAPNKINFNLPNLPQYRFGGACDSTIAFPQPHDDTVSVATQAVGEMRIEVFPNPFREHLTVSFTEHMPHGARLVLYDQMGRQVLERLLPAGTNLFETSGLPAGVYFYEVWEKEGRRGSGKVVRVE